MTFFDTQKLEKTEMLPGVTRQAVWLDNLMVTFVHLEEDGEVPEHSHPHEQITYVVEGTVRFTLDDEVRLLEAGEGACCPPDTPHRAVPVGGPAYVLDAWHPPREDYK